MFNQFFDWCKIPAGKVKVIPGTYDKKNYYLKEDTIFDIPAFLMAKYPVTHAQYSKFIKAGGYENKSWWTESGWQTKETKTWIEPLYWSDKDYKDFHDNNKPVVGVSWYEAIAFCQWLSETTGEAISLPTEQQWQRAAQGDDGRTFPWGNEIDAKKANTLAHSRGKTSPVNAYPKGASPYGVFDMAGNVSEWVLTEYKTGSHVPEGINKRILRGGSFYTYPVNVRSIDRAAFFPSIRLTYLGFRICAASSSL